MTALLSKAAAQAVARENAKRRKKVIARVSRSRALSIVWLALIGGMAANAYANVTIPAVGPFSEDPPAVAAAAPPQAPAEDVHLLAATAWAEARSEGEEGMRAVAHVVVNRIGSPRFGDSLSEVILHPKQFSAWNAHDPNRPLALNPERYAQTGVNHDTWETAQVVAREVLEGRSVDPTNGALFYHTNAVHPYWSSGGVGRHVIGHHVFYADVVARSGA